MCVKGRAEHTYTPKYGKRDWHISESICTPEETCICVMCRAESYIN